MNSVACVTRSVRKVTPSHPTFLRALSICDCNVLRDSTVPALAWKNIGFDGS